MQKQITYHTQMWKKEQKRKAKQKKYTFFSFSFFSKAEIKSFTSFHFDLRQTTDTDLYTFIWFCCCCCCCCLILLFKIVHSKFIRLCLIVTKQKHTKVYKEWYGIYLNDSRQSKIRRLNKLEFHCVWVTLSSFHFYLIFFAFSLLFLFPSLLSLLITSPYIFILTV